MSENLIPKAAIRESDIHIDTHTREVVKIHGPAKISQPNREMDFIECSVNGL